MFSINANTMYSFDEKGNHSLEISYNDSNGTNVGASVGISLDLTLFSLFSSVLCRCILIFEVFLISTHVTADNTAVRTMITTPDAFFIAYSLP